MAKFIHKASERGIADHGWLKAAHSFSFANYYNPGKIHFMLTEGKVEIEGTTLEKRDAAGFWSISEPLKIAMGENPKLLAIEVPMH